MSQPYGGGPQQPYGGPPPGPYQQQGQPYPPAHQPPPGYQGQPPPQGFAPPPGAPQPAMANPAMPMGGPPPGTGRLLMDLSFFKMAWFLFFIKPVLVVDGQPAQVAWGQMPVDLPPGQHHVQVSFPYMGKQRGVAQATIPVTAGQQQQVFYRAPALITKPGAMGPGPQPTPGIEFVMIMNGVMVLVLLLVFLLPFLR